MADSKSKPKKKTAMKLPAAPGRSDMKLYTLKVFLAVNPRGKSKKFRYKKWSPEISRTIQIEGDQFLYDLHATIFSAFNRYDEHLWEFVIGITPYRPESVLYQFAPFGPDELIGGWGADSPTVLDQDGVTIDQLNLKPKQVFAYHFDYGDDWWHRIDVLSIEDAPPTGKFPRVTERVGRSPPQYPPGG